MVNLQKSKLSSEKLEVESEGSKFGCQGSALLLASKSQETDLLGVLGLVLKNSICALRVA